MKRTIWLLAAALATPFAASAEDKLSYTYLEAGYSSLNPEFGERLDGVGIGGSAAITDHLHVFGGYQRTDNDDFDVRGYQIGLGYNTAITDKVDFVGRVSYRSFDEDFFDNANGYGVEAGVRVAFNPHFEGSAGVRYEDIDEYQETSLVLGAQYKFNEHWGIAAEIAGNGDQNSYFVGPRVSF